MIIKNSSMKKAIFIAFILAAWIGMGLVAEPAHAAPVTIVVSDITPEQAAVLNAELNAMKDTLIQIQGQYSGGTAVYEPLPQSIAPAGLSAETKMQISQTLGVLATTLVQMQNTLAAGNPTQTELDAMSMTLAGIGSSVGSIVATVAAAQTGGGQVIAQAPASTPQPTSAYEPAPEENMPQIAGSDQGEESIGYATDEASESGVAQAASTVGGRRWIVPAIIVLIILIAAVWFWRSKGETSKPKSQAIQTTQKESTL